MGDAVLWWSYPRLLVPKVVGGEMGRTRVYTTGLGWYNKHPERKWVNTII